MKTKYLGLLFLVFFGVFFLSACSEENRDITASVPAGEYYGEQHLTLTCNDPTAEIRYTLDGSDPGESNIVYNPEMGITISFTSDLKATAGGNMFEAHYDIIPYSPSKTPEAQAYYNMIQGDYATDDTYSDEFTITNSAVHFITPDKTVTSGYALIDINGNNATLVYTDDAGNNVRVPLGYNPDTYQLTINGKVYTPEYLL